MTLNDFDTTINYWIILLDKYSFNQILAKSASNKWSLGQLINHLIESSSFFLQNSKDCLANHENGNQEISSPAREIFRNNELPNIEIEGPESNNFTPQPQNLQALKAGLINLKLEFCLVRDNLLLNQPSGKKKHPGLGYFNAAEWYQFAEIHLRHHIRQKDRIEFHLNENNSGIF